MLQDDHTFFRSLFDFAAVGMIIADPQARVLHCNFALAAMLGYRREELAGRPMAALLHPEEASRIPFELLPRDRKPVRGEWRFQRQDGSGFAAEALIRKTPQGYIHVIVSDIGERTQAGAARRDRERRDRYFLNLDERLRTAKTPREMVGIACEAIGLELGAGVAGVGEFRQDSETILAESAWSATGDLESLLGRHPHFPASRITELLLAGGATTVEDTLTDERIAADAGAQAAAKAIGARSGILAPLLREGRPRAFLLVGVTAPRQWTEEEAALARDTLDRVWQAVERARAEEELRLATERFEVALKGSPIAVLSQDLDLRHTWVYNTCFCPSQLIGKTEAEVFERAEDAAASQAIKRKAILTGESQRAEIAVRIGGVDRIYDLLADPLRDRSGKIAGVTCAMIDITARKRAEEALRESEELLRLSMQSTGAAAWRWDVPAGVFIGSPDAYRLYGCGAGAGGPRKFDDWHRRLHPDDRARVDGTALDIFAKRSLEYRDDYRVVFPSGEVHWLDVRANVEYAADGSPLRVSGISLDVTARKQAEEALRQSEELLRLSMRGAGAAPYRWEIKTGEAFGSPESYRLYGRDPNPAKPYRYDDWVGCLHPDERAKTERDLFEAFERGVVEHRTEYRIVLPSGEVRWLDSLGKVEYAEDGSPVRMWGLNLDITERKRAEEALRESEELLRLSVRGAGAAPWRWDIQSDILFGSRESCELYGRDWNCIQPPSSSDWLECLHADDRARAAKSISDVLEKRSSEYRAEYRILRPSGEVRWLDALANVDYAEDGSPLRMFGINLDVTERKQAEEALRESEERLLFCLKSAHAGAWQVDIPAKQLIWSPECCEVHGRDPKLGSPDYDGWLQCIHPDDRVRVEQENLKALIGRIPEFKLEYRVVLPTGETRWLEGLGKVDYAEDGSPLRASGINIDITAHKRAEEALRESEERLRFSLKGAGAAAWQCDIPGRRIIWSEDCCELNGRDPKLGSPGYGEWLDCVHPSDRPKVETLSFHALSKGEPEFKLEYRVPLPSGEMRWVEALGKVDYGADGAPLRISGISLDVTGRKQAEEALRKAEVLQRQKRHELETILAAIPAAVLIAKDAACTEMTGNAAAYKLLQRPPGTNLSKSPPAGEGPSNFDIYANGRLLPFDEWAIRNAVATKRAVTGDEIEIRFVEGGGKFLLGNALPLLDGDGEVRGAVAAFTDITRLKRTEMALRESEERLQFALHAAKSGTWEVDLETGKITASDRPLFLPEGVALKVKNAFTNVYPADRGRLLDALRRTLETGEFVGAEWRVTLPDGSVRWVESRGQPRPVSGKDVISGLVLDITERKRAEIALQESEELLRAIIENVPVPILLSREDRKILLVNPELTKVAGYTPADIPTRDEWEAYAYREHADEIKKRAGALFERWVPSDNGAVWIYTKSGERRLWAIKTAPAGRDASGKRLGVTVALDITERQKSSEDARRSSAMLEAALASMADVVLISDTNGRFIHYNTAFASFHGLETKEARLCALEDRNAAADLFLPSGEYVPPRDWPCPKALRGETAANVEYLIRRRDGEIYCSSNFAPIRDGSGEIIGAVVTARDITDQKSAERRLRESEARLASIIDTAADAIIVVDEKGAIQSANPSCASIFGYGPDELAGRHASILLPPHMRKGLDKFLSGLLGSGGIWEMEAQRKSGETIPLNVAVAEWRDGEGNRFRTAILRDLSERKRNEEALANARRLEAVGQLAGGVAHDFNNLLSVIAGNLDLAQDRIDDETARLLLRRALDAAEKGASLNRKLLSLARKRALRPERLNLNDRVEETAKLLMSTVGEHIAVATDLADGLWTTLADPGEVDSAILNLAANARDALPNGGRIAIATSNFALGATDAAKLSAEAKPGNYVCLSIADNGVGMPESVREKAMDPFFTTKNSGAGTGLGLTSVASFARQSGGFATISSAPGKGCAVRICLPRCLDEAPPAAGPGQEIALGDGELVLVAEDDDQVREMTLKRIEGLGYAVAEARTGPEALAVLASDAPVQLVLSDVVMPGGMTGYDVARWVASNRPDIKVILCSGYNEGDRGGEDRAPVESGVALGKPYTREQLARALRDALAS